MTELSVLHVVSSMDPAAGGVSSALAGLAVAQQRSGLIVKIVTTHTAASRSELVDWVRQNGVEVTLVEGTRTSYQWHPGMRKILRALVRSSDLVHIHALWEHIQLVACSEAKLSGKPYLICPHGMLEPWSLGQSALKKRLYLKMFLAKYLASATAIHFTSVRESRLWPVNLVHRDSVLIPNGVDLDEFEDLSDGSGFRRANGIPETARVVLFLGRLHEKKGCELLIQGFTKAVQRFSEHEQSNFYLLFVGPGDTTIVSRLENIISSSGLDTVLLLGPLYGRDRIQAFCAADYFALVSQQENFGVAIVEALASRVPVLVSDQVGLSDLVSDEAIGKVVEYDVEQVCEALFQVFAGEPDSEIGNRCRAVAERFDWPPIAKNG